MNKTPVFKQRCSGRHFVFVLAVGLAVFLIGDSVVHEESHGCRPIVPRETGAAAIGEPGNYCLLQDLHVGSHYNPFAHSSRIRGDDASLLVLGADNIVVDLSGHKITGHAPLRGGIETPIAGDPDYKYLPELTNLDRGEWAKNLTIQNGELRLTSRAGDADGIRLADQNCFFNTSADLSDLWKSSSSEALEFEKRLERVLNEKLPKTPRDYAVRNIKIDKMKIRTINVGIRIQGANTVIRNSTIEVDAGTAISIYGPGALIENNTIIVHGDYHLQGADAPIRLHHGDNAVIRNNRIVIKGSAPKRVVSAFYTGEFAVQNNIIRGLTDKDSIAKAFTGELNVNAAGNQFR